MGWASLLKSTRCLSTRQQQPPPGPGLVPSPKMVSAPSQPRGCQPAVASFSPPQQPLFLLECPSHSLQSIISCWVHPGVPLPLTGSWGASWHPPARLCPVLLDLGDGACQSCSSFPSCVLLWDCSFQRGFVPLVSPFPSLNYSWWVFQCPLKASLQLFSPIPLSKTKLSADGLVLDFCWSGSLAFPANAGVSAQALSAPVPLVPVKVLHELGDGAEVGVANLLDQCHVVAAQYLWG